MAMIWGGNKSAWDFSNPKNWVINKSLEQNLAELYTGMQIIGTVVPPAMAFKVGTAYTIPTSLAPSIAGAGATVGAGAGAGAAGAGAAGAGAAIGAALLTKEAAQIALLTGITAWLTKYWYIPAILLGIVTIGKFGGK